MAPFRFNFKGKVNTLAGHTKNLKAARNSAKARVEAARKIQAAYRAALERRRKRANLNNITLANRLRSIKAEKAAAAKKAKNATPAKKVVKKATPAKKVVKRKSVSTQVNDKTTLEKLHALVSKGRKMIIKAITHVRERESAEFEREWKYQKPPLNTIYDHKAGKKIVMEGKGITQWVDDAVGGDYNEYRSTWRLANYRRGPMSTLEKGHELPKLRTGWMNEMTNDVSRLLKHNNSHWFNKVAEILVAHITLQHAIVLKLSREVKGSYGLRARYKANALKINALLTSKAGKRIFATTRYGGYWRGANVSSQIHLKYKNRKKIKADAHILTGARDILRRYIKGMKSLADRRVATFELMWKFNPVHTLTTAKGGRRDYSIRPFEGTQSETRGASVNWNWEFFWKMANENENAPPGHKR